MARSKKVKVGNDQISKLHEALKNGTSPVGLKGYVATDFYDAEQEEIPIVIKVEIVELKADCNGVAIMVKPAAGSGTFKISPCKWFDTTLAFQQKLEETQILDEAIAQYEYVMGHSLITARKDRLLNLANETFPLIDAMKRELVESGYATEETTEKLLLKKVPEGVLKRLTLALVSIKYQVSEEQLKDKLGYRYN